MEYTKGEWYLPAFGVVYGYLYPNFFELVLMYDKISISVGEYWWSSSEANSVQAWTISGWDGSSPDRTKQGNYQVPCFLEIG